MGTRLGAMGAFLENPMFLFMDDAEPILPILRSTEREYGGRGRIVELADVGCDTETTFPMHSPRGAFDRRRGGAENHRSTRRIAKRFNDNPNGFTRRARDVNNNEDRNRNYIRGTMRRDVPDYDYVPDLDSNEYSYAEISYDNFELAKNDLDVEEDDDYYIQFVNPQNAVAHFRRERIPQHYNYSKDLESPFVQSARIPQWKNTYPRWLAESKEKNFCEIHDSDVQPGNRKKRTKILSRADGNINRETEFEKTREITMHGERDDPPDAAVPVTPTKNMFWDFISFENDRECVKRTFHGPAKNRGGLRKVAPCKRRSYILDSEPKHVGTVDSEGEKEFKETLKRDSRENLSPEITINIARNRTTKGDAVKEKPKIMRLNISNVNSSRKQSRTFIDKKISSVHPAEKNSINMRPPSATEGKGNDSTTTEGREETGATRTIVDDRRYRDKFVNKLSNNFLKKPSRSTKPFNRVAGSMSNGRMDAANEKDSTNSHRGNAGNSKMDQINVTVSRVAPEENVTTNKRTFAWRTTSASMSRTDIKKEKKRKFFSRLPVRTWKRLSTNVPAALRPKNDATNEDTNPKIQEVQGNETAKSCDHPERVENDNVRESDRAAENCNHSVTGSLGADKPGLTSSGVKSIKGIKGSSTARGAREQRKKGTSVK